MKNSDRGQTVIETALMIILLFVLFFGIAEIARFWWLKNQVNNAARVGVRVAIADSTLKSAMGSLGSTPTYVPIATCGGTSNCGVNSSTGAISTTAIQDAACSSITNSAACNGTTVSLIVAPDPDTGAYSPGGIISVQVSSPPVPSIVPGLADLSFGLIPSSIILSSSSTMRHE